MGDSFIWGELVRPMLMLMDREVGGIKTLRMVESHREKFYISLKICT